MKLFKDDILAKWKGDSSITYIETRQELEELLKKEDIVIQKEIPNMDTSIEVIKSTIIFKGGLIRFSTITGNVESIVYAKQEPGNEVTVWGFLPRVNAETKEEKNKELIKKCVHAIGPESSVDFTP